MCQRGPPSAVRAKAKALSLVARAGEGGSCRGSASSPEEPCRRQAQAGQGAPWPRYCRAAGGLGPPQLPPPSQLTLLRIGLPCGATLSNGLVCHASLGLVCNARNLFGVQCT